MGSLQNKDSDSRKIFYFSSKSPNPNPNPNSFDDDESWSLSTEEQLEELLFKKLDSLYKAALSLSLLIAAEGIDETLALCAILSCGGCYKFMDVDSERTYLKLGAGAGAAAFADLRHLEEFSLAAMISLLQCAGESRGDAMWLLLTCGLTIPMSVLLESKKRVSVVLLLAFFDRMKDEILRLNKQICDLEEEVQTKKNEAHQRVIKFAELVSKALSELMVSRMKEEAERSKNETAEIKADIMALELIASELASKSSNALKSGKKYSKKLRASAKLRKKVQAEVKEKKKMPLIHVTEKEVLAKVKLREERKAKEEAIVLVEEA